MTIIHRGPTNDKWESHQGVHPMTEGIIYKDPEIDRTSRTPKKHPIRNKTDGTTHTHRQRFFLCMGGHSMLFLRSVYYVILYCMARKLDEFSLSLLPHCSYNPLYLCEYHRAVGGPHSLLEFPERPPR